MSFTRNNEHFLRLEFHIPLRGLVGTDREIKYAHQIRTEARRRITLYYESIKNDISKKTAFYEELLEIFGPLEKRWLLYSIFLDPHSDQIGLKVGRSVIQNLDMSKDSLRAFFEQKAPLHDQSFSKGFLKQYFTVTLDLSPGEWETEDGKNNPVTNKLITWLADKITKEPNTKELEQFILNYTKLWNVYFVRIYNINKALILVHKFYELYRNLEPKGLKVDLDDLLTFLNSFISELLPEVFNSPLTDVCEPSEILKDGSYRNQSSTKAYLNKNSEFRERITNNAIFFKDFGDTRWSDLFNQACAAPPSAQKAYLIEMEKRYASLKPPNFKDIDQFISMIPENKTPLDGKMLDSIISTNYIFF